MKDHKAKRINQYKDKWSINLIKKAVLTNIQIQNRNLPIDYNRFI